MMNNNMKTNLALGIITFLPLIFGCEKKNPSPTPYLQVKAVLGTTRMQMGGVTTQLSQGGTYNFYKGDFEKVILSCVGTCTYTVNGEKYSTVTEFKL